MKIGIVTAAAIAAGLLSSPAQASLVFANDVQLTGQGIGSAFTVLTLQSPGSSTFESGGVTFSGTAFGDAGTGAQQTRTFTFADLGISNAGQLAIIVNLSEPNSETPPSVTTANPFAITLTAYNANGSVAESFSTAAGLTLNQIAGGVGGSGLVFRLDADQTLALNNFINANAGDERFALSASLANASGGVDVFQVAQIAAVPEPATWAMMLAGFLGLGSVAYRRRRRNGAAFRLV